MLTPHEQRVWDGIVGCHRAAERREELPAVVIGGGWGAVLLLLFGVPMAALAVAAATALVWVLWRFAPQLADTGDGDQPVPEPERRSRTAG
jgi:hypothetical protein